MQSTRRKYSWWPCKDDISSSHQQVCTVNVTAKGKCGSNGRLTADSHVPESGKAQKRRRLLSSQLYWHTSFSAGLMNTIPTHKLRQVWKSYGKADFTGDGCYHAYMFSFSPVPRAKVCLSGLPQHWHWRHTQQHGTHLLRISATAGFWPARHSWALPFTTNHVAKNEETLIVSEVRQGSGQSWGRFRESQKTVQGTAKL